MNNLAKAPLILSALLVTSLALPGSVFAYYKGEGPDADTPPRPGETRPGSSISLAFDNDVLVPGSRDQDYTYGLNITYAGNAADDTLLPVQHSLDWVDHQLGIDFSFNSGIETRKVEFGMFGFTPEDISAADPIEGDRPYASLVYVSSSRERIDRERQVAWQSTLTIGVLGLDLVSEVQNKVHDITGSDHARGWDHQISSGGEPTVRYNLSRQGLLFRSGDGFELKSTLQASVGYITEASWGVSARFGKIQTPWASFNPELATYGERSVPADAGKINEQYFFAGAALKARLYNVFLQGQFRDSDLSYASDELNHGIIEVWMGYTVGLNNGYSLTYSVRGHSSEIKDGPGDRNVVWGGLLLTRNFS